MTFSYFSLNVRCYGINVEITPAFSWPGRSQGKASAIVAMLNDQRVKNIDKKGLEAFSAELSATCVASAVEPFEAEVEVGTTEPP